MLEVLVEANWPSATDRVLRLRCAVIGQDFGSADEGLSVEGRVSAADPWTRIVLIRAWAYSGLYTIGDALSVFGGPARDCVQDGGWADVDVEIPDAYTELQLIPALTDTNLRHDIALWSAELRNEAVALADAVAPTVAIDAVVDGNENTTVLLGATFTGGTYDAVDYDWTVEGGTLDDNTLAMPIWTRPTVSADTDFNINLEITARGTGTDAASGTSDTADAPTVTATVLDIVVLPDAVAPNVTVDAVADFDETGTAALSLTLAGGTYDGLSYVWSIRFGGGTLSSTTAASVTYTPADVASDTNVRVRCVVTATGTGANAADGTSATPTAIPRTLR